MPLKKTFRIAGGVTTPFAEGWRLSQLYNEFRRLDTGGSYVAPGDGLIEQAAQDVFDFWVHAVSLTKLPSFEKHFGFTSAVMQTQGIYVRVRFTRVKPN